MTAIRKTSRALQGRHEDVIRALWKRYVGARGGGAKELSRHYAGFMKALRGRDEGAMRALKRCHEGNIHAP